ncbi:hypothetical protein PGT21_025055 [Puccinia graminis f. sp. tritici]|uniref:Midasin n=1 Tax=Puccinia graminis f. sp. tritici TaxID=56615 RepID=A0A5B0QX47_PUCGR|nr:hypothetical protein PGT21_025055 [Puccinia graminis f. sp. tritici]
MDDFDLLGALHDFLHQIGLLPLSSAPSTKLSSSLSAGTIIHHHLCSDIPAHDIHFLLNLVKANPPQTSTESFNLPDHDPVPRFLEILAQLALLPPFTCHVSAHFAPILPELASRWILSLEFQEGGRYSDQVCSYWPAQPDQDESLHSEQSHPPAKENIKSNLRSIISAFSLLLPHHASLFPLFLILVRHPALRTDPFQALPVETLASISRLDHPLAANHPLYQSKAVDPYILAISRLLLVSPHLPYPGLVLQGWILPPVLLNILKFHPRRGIRQLAWYCWKLWQGPACSSQLIKDVKDQYVWKRNPSEISPIEDHFSSPWSHKSPQNQDQEDTPMNTTIDGSSDDTIIVEEQLTCKWSAHLSGSSPETVFSYEVVFRAIDAWVLEVDETHRISQLKSRPKSASVQRNVDLPLLLLQDCHLTKLIAAIEGNLLLKFHALPPPTRINNLLTAAQSPISEKGRQIRSDIVPHQAPFVSTSSSVLALKSLSQHISQRFPVLLSGPPSSGKNTIIQKLAAHLWSKNLSFDHTIIDQSEFDQNVVILNLASRTLDAKSLVGSYVSSTEDPGKFVFVEGPLLKAMKEGKWIVCQDIDRASDDVLSVINQLADLISHRAQYQVGGGYGGHGGPNGVGIDLGAQCGWVSANERFLLLATRTCQHDKGKSFVGEEYWKEVVISSMTKEDILILITRQTPNFSEDVRHRLVAAWEEVSSSHMDSSRRRPIQLIDLLKWVTRIKGLLSNNQILSSVSQNPVLQEQIFLEGVDLFLASSETFPVEGDNLASNLDLNVAQALGTHLDLNPERSAYCICRRIPDYIPPAQKPKGGSSGKGKTHATIGRVKQAIDKSLVGSMISNSRPFALTKSTLVLLERLAVCMRSSEPALLVGETGTGKTTVVSYMASLIGKRLISLNLSNQSEASDLLGGFKPLDSAEDGKLHGNCLVDDFINTFGDAFNTSRNHEFVHAIRKAASKKKYIRLVALLKDGIRALSERLNTKLKSADERLHTEMNDCHEPSKRRKTNITRSKTFETTQAQMKSSLQDYLFQVNQFEDKFVRSTSNHMRFRFVEGPLVKALQNGDWVLLDEINLGTTETLEALSGLLRHPNASVVLSERGDLVPVPRHPDFRLIGCMNPATDVGKRDLPASLRSKFTELYVQPPDNDREALLNIISQHLGGLCASDKRAIPDTADCYSAIRTLARNGSLADGTNAPPHYSMRTLSRALTFATEISSSLCLRRALVEGFLMAFVTTLDTKSTEVVYQLIDRHIVQTGKNPKAILSQLPKKPEDHESYIQVGPFWLKKAQVLDESTVTQEYVLTGSVKSKIIDLARAVTTGRWPVLIQGPTSSGKTSIVAYIARLTGHPFVRINNHEHTDIQEYIGSYATDPETGRLCFKEGALVRALRQGAWVVLDELNLAPSDVLEALNRLLDDNRELLIPETQEIVKPHPDFMLFATQNPPGLYGGRKVLSRAFRNRFIELHFDDVPKDELEVILCQRCAIAPSHANKIVQVFAELQRRRQSDKIFEQKHSFVTLRDLFRWGGRGAVGYQELAEDGYMLLAERSRGKEEKETVKQVLEEIMNVTINPDCLYQDVQLPKSLVATEACKRLFKLVSRCLQFNEPVLLVGDAGSGKTSVCEALSLFTNHRLRSINLHRNSEVGDLLGSQRPIRQRAEKIQTALQQLQASLACLEIKISITDGSDTDDVISNTEKALAQKKRLLSDSKAIDQAQMALSQLKKSTALFDWSDGPLIQAMQEGDHVLLDEISLADDSVLERLNSLLEPERSIVLAERGGQTLDEMQITAHSTFQIFATMNPGGDFGKRELSPALRNRFTEIWVPLVSDPQDRFAIYCDRLSHKAQSPTCSSFVPSEWAAHIISFSEFYSKSPISAQFSTCELSLRDGLAWCDFIRSCSSLAPPLSFIHGAQMTVLDRIGTAGFGQDLSVNLTHELRGSCLDYLHQLANVLQDSSEGGHQVKYTAEGLQIGDFVLQKSTPTIAEPTSTNYSFSAQTVAHNAMRIIRALQVPKAVLLEGSPGVGKTSIVEALAKLSGKRLQRINLSDQTDLLDLFGADAPVEGGSPGQFEWKDASFLDALQKGDWVLLDEMNLAPQTVLEGLNGCLDYRGTVYVPEIDRTFKRHPDFRVFAAQNPHHQGGSRKGLPKSLVDRFTVVFMKEMEKEDLLQICTEMAPVYNQSVISGMVNLNYRLAEETNNPSSFASLGSPWEFNLRDLGRWMQVTSMSGKYDLQPLSPVEYVDMIYTGRFRTQDDQTISARISREFFHASSMSRDHQDLVELPSELVIGHSRLAKPAGLSWTPPIVSPLEIPPCLYNCAEALIRCLELKWLPILTGMERSGKSSLVKFLAARKGVQLRVINLHSGTDTSDLIGGFEQSNTERKLIAILEDISETIQQDLNNFYLSRDARTSNLEMCRRDLNHIKDLVFSFETNRLVSCALQILQQPEKLSLAPHYERFERSLLDLQSGKPGCRFEWIDGPLVTSMKKGQWLLVENSNLCSASVLDRLNPLFEGTGRLQLAEKGMCQGGIDTVIPHENFRIIFAFNPRYGELSRAMRNRGVEIAFLPDPQLHLISSPLPFKTTLLSSSNVIQDPVMRWTAHALVHSPSEFPLLSRIIDHFLSSPSPDHSLKLLLNRLLQPDVLEVVVGWAQLNRVNHFLIGEAFDLAIGSQSTQHLLDQGKALGHRCFLRLIIAACLPIRLLTHQASLESNGPKKIPSEPSIKHSHLINHVHFSRFVHLASDVILRTSLFILSKTQDNHSLSDFEISEYQRSFESIRDIQEATLQMINLLESTPDHAAIGFALKMIDDSVNQAPIQSKSSFDPIKLSLQPLRDSHDISRWEGLVLLWNLFCPPWYKDLHLVTLVNQLGQLCEANWSLLDIGLSFTSRALKLWHLYIPDVPIDPLSVQTAHHSYLQAWASRLGQLREFLASYQQAKGRVSSNPRIKQLDDEIEVIHSRCKEIPKPSIQRSTDTLVQHAIFTELKAFEKQFLVDGRLEDLVQALARPENQDCLQALHARIENFSFSAIGLLNRLSKRFPTSVDILWPVQAFLHVMIADLTLSFQRAMSDCSNPSARVITDFIGCLTKSTPTIAAANLRDDPLIETAQMTVADEAGQSVISLLYISAMTKFPITEFESPQTHKLLSFYDKLWQLWTRDCIRLQKEAEEKAQEFKTRRQDIIIKSDEEIEEEELQDLFPSYEDNLPRASSNSSTNLVTPLQISLLCKIHLSIMSAKVDEEHSRSCFDSLRQQIVVAMVEKHGLALPSNLDQSSLAFQFHSLCQLLKSSTSPSNSKANFYTDSNTAETTRVVPFVKALASKIEALIRQWPEMTTLDEILQRCRKVAALSSDSPLALIIPQLEALIGQIEEWQKYSCAENSLLSFQSDLTALVVSWRRLELASWAALIQTELDSFHLTTDVWWFRLYELLVRGYSTHSHTPDNQEAKSYLKDCALVLNQYLTECNLGQFGYRLTLLNSFSALLRAVSRISNFGCWSRINNLLDGIIYFYSHYEPLVDQKIEQAKRLARSEIESYIQLASWKDVNIIALRQSSQKSHRQLYKTIRKFRSVLQGPMKDMLQRWPVKKSGDIEARLPTILQENELSRSCQINPILWNQYTESLSMPSYLSQPQNILKRLQKLVQSNGFLSQDVAIAASEIAELSTHIFSVAKELSEVKIPRGDGRERFARNLDLRKRKAFSELLKKLRLLGIGTSPTDRLLLQLSDPAVVMSQPLLGPEGFSEVQLCCQDSDELIFALLNEMPQFRKYRSQHHSDIPNADMERLIGSIESGLALILAERQSLSTLVKTVKHIEQSLLRMSNLLVSTSFCTSKTTGNQLCDISKKIIQHQKLCVNSIEEASEFIAQLTNQQGRGPTGINDMLQEIIQTVVENASLVQDIIMFSGTSITLLKPNEADALQKINANFNATTDRLESLALSFPDFNFILSPLAQQLRHHQTTIPNFDDVDGCSSEKAWGSMKKLTDSILVVIQDLARPKDPQSDLITSKKAPGLLRKAHSEFASLTGQCHLEEILQNLSNFNQAVSFTTNSEEISLLLNMGASLLRQYLQLISNHLLEYLRWHRSNLHLLHTIVSIGANIAEQGFCKPDFREEEEDSAGKDGPSRDGTGLGGGQGAKDVSDEIEDDEQLEGLQGEVDEEKPEADQDASKEDKAVETQQDFDASLEDVEDADDSESNANEDDEADDEVEDGLGKVDPLDSGAVDENFGRVKTKQGMSPKPTTQT